MVMPEERAAGPFLNDRLECIWSILLAARSNREIDVLCIFLKIQLGHVEDRTIFVLNTTTLMGKAILAQVVHSPLLIGLRV